MGSFGGGGMTSPDSFATALNRLGHTSKHTPHFVHFSRSIQWTIFLPPWMAPKGQFLRHRPHAVHFSGSM
jgi:hypothetical protein